jgi:hypothetical protein
LGPAFVSEHVVSDGEKPDPLTVIVWPGCPE